MKCDRCQRMIVAGQALNVGDGTNIKNQMVCLYRFLPITMIPFDDLRDCEGFEPKEPAHD